MKKHIAILLFLVMIVSMVSCDLNENQSNPSQNENTDNENFDSDESDNKTTQISDAEHAMQMYGAAIKGEICVFDERAGEIRLEDYRFPSNNLRLGECEILNKAILDMDGDGINEYVIQSPNKDHIVLHYYGRKVFSYCFDRSNFYNLNTDGSYFWSDSYESENWTHGLNQITFDGKSLNIKELYRIKHIFPFDFYENLEFYVDGKQITREEFLDYHKSGTLVIFSPLDISCEYPISSEKACEIASNYWEIDSGMNEGAAGTLILHRIVILEKPNSDTQGYRISWQLEGYRNHVPDHQYSLPPKTVILHKELFVDAITGECREYTDSERAMQMYGAAINDEICVIDEHLGEIKLKDCRFPSNDLLLGECEILNKAILDMDGDGINEYVIQSPNKDHIILHYYDGKVYSYCFDNTRFCNLNTDGSFYWSDNSLNSNECFIGSSRLVFDGALLDVKEIYSMKLYFDGIISYYLEGKQVTYNDYLEFYNANNKTRMTFSPLDILCQYPISSEQAWKIADTYWKGVSGREEGACGTTIFNKVVILSKPSSDNRYYRIGWQFEGYSHVNDGWECNYLPSYVGTHEELLVDAFTGECYEYVAPELDGKG